MQSQAKGIQQMSDLRGINYPLPPLADLEENVSMKSHVRADIRISYFAKRALLLVAAAAAFLLAAQSAQAAPEDFGIQSVGASLSTLEAGRHPDVITSIEYKAPSSEPVPDPDSLAIELPPGLTANPQNFPECPFAVFNNSFQTPCPQDAQIGTVEVGFLGVVEKPLREPLYILSSSEDEVVRLGFVAMFYPTFLEVDLRSGSDYGITVTSQNIPNTLHITSIKSDTWGVPAASTHDTERLTPLEALPFVCAGEANGTPCLAGGSRRSESPPVPFMTNPASCGPLEFRFKTTAYLLPGQTFSAAAQAGDTTGCDVVPFNPSLALKTTSRRAGAPTGLQATLEMPQDEAVNTINTAPLRTARVVLPEGFTVNSSAADGLEACSAHQAALGTDGPANCPLASKLGIMEVFSPSLKRPIKGGIFLRTPEPGHLFRFWLVSNELGVNLKVPAEVELNESNGRLTAIVPESPQLPAEQVVLKLNGGGRAPLRNPQSCGTFEATYEFGPWSGNAPLVGTAPMSIDEGCGSQGFAPKLSAGSASPAAGKFSPFVFEVTRDDKDQNISKLDVSLPPGLTAKLAGVPLCPEAVANSGTCPADSKIGDVEAAVGAGTQPLWIPQPGKEGPVVYLAGAYRDAPYSVIAKVPAQAGPFDLGIVTVRSGIYVDPETAEVTVKSDELPQILQGIPVDYRLVRILVNRDQFTLNPTSCAEQLVRAAMFSASGTSASASDRFQAADCASLAFSPALSLRLKGGSKRTAHPSLRAVVRAKRGEANIKKVSVTLPHSEFLEQGHIRTVCTRVQFAQDACPKASIYGRATATTPLLDQPLRGPVYLRSSNHELPDLVVDLRGPLRITLSGRIDSLNGGIRTTFNPTPDAPIRKFSLTLWGGSKGLLVNSKNLCTSVNRATVGMAGQNGKQAYLRPVLRNVC